MFLTTHNAVVPKILLDSYVILRILILGLHSSKWSHMIIYRILLDQIQRNSSYIPRMPCIDYIGMFEGLNSNQILIKHHIACSFNVKIHCNSTRGLIHIKIFQRMYKKKGYKGLHLTLNIWYYLYLKTL